MSKLSIEYASPSFRETRGGDIELTNEILQLVSYGGSGVIIS